MVSPDEGAGAGEAWVAGVGAGAVDFFSQPTANSATVAVVAARSVLMGNPSRARQRTAGVF
jgi:hypothetical protein